MLVLARGSRRLVSDYAVILVPLVGAPWFALSERNSPGSIIVNMTGKRFMNESMPYVEACHHTYGGEYGQGAGPGENIPAWLVFDQQYRDRYIFAGLNPGQRIPRKWLESGVIVAADTLEERAAKTGLPAEAPTATVERFNGFARSRVDEDYQRGESAYDRYYGDPTNKPNPNLGEISHAAVLRGHDGAGRPRDQGRHPHRRARPRAARRRFGDRGDSMPQAMSARR